MGIKTGKAIRQSYDCAGGILARRKRKVVWGNEQHAAVRNQLPTMIGPSRYRFWPSSPGSGKAIRGVPSL